MRRRVAALALLFLAAHLPLLPPSLEDLDSFNLALGVREFDVARHQPHPPGYPVFIAAAKLSTPALRTLGVAAPDARGLAIWSALCGAAVIPLLFLLFRSLAGDERRAWWATVVSACAPLFWFTALRPLSDMTGFAAAVAALAALGVSLTSARPGRALTAGGLLAGVAIGVRSQTFLLTLPLLALALCRRGLARRERIAGVAAASVGVLAWAVPLVIASGGPARYLAALGSQGAEDFSGVVMLWTHRTPRVALDALLHTFVLPWDSPVLAAIVLALAAAGVFAARRAWRVLALLGVTFAPYALFHLLLQETVTVRYALPLVPPVAWLAMAGADALLRRASAAAAIGVAAASIALALPAAVAFGREAAPIVRALDDMSRAATGREPRIGLHRRVASESRRAIPWRGGVPGRQLPSPRDYEWLELTAGWRAGEQGPAWFLADPARTDLALVDDVGRRVTRYRWGFDPKVYVGGARPNEMDWHAFESPGWFLERGWAITPEIAGITARDGAGPHRQPSGGWIRRRTGAALLVLGGRHLGGAADPPVRLTATIDGRPMVALDARPGFFVQAVQLPAGSLSPGTGLYAPLQVRAHVQGGGAVPAVALEQFDVQSPGVAMLAFDEGWYEPEYNPRTALSWRWASERAALVIHNSAADVEITVSGESPLRYFDRAPLVRVMVGETEVARFSPGADFSERIVVPHRLLAASGGRVTLESNEWFSPAARGESADPRHLALRIYSVRVRP